MRELALHLLDLAQNSLAAGATRLWIEVRLDQRADRLSMEIKDNGRGIAPGMLAQVTDPFVTTRATRHVGLGLPLLKAAAERCEGALTISSVPGAGTSVASTFRLSHVDRMPLGDLAGTIVGLIACNPWLELDLKADWNGFRFEFTTADCRRVLGGEVSLCEPVVLTHLKDFLANSLAELRREDEAAAGLQWKKAQ
ncbi:MAG: ATP-binding protein [Bacteroidota bacterium]